jgi:hypothetical protein
VYWHDSSEIGFVVKNICQGYNKIKVTIQPIKTCPLMLILMITLKTINNIYALEKRNQLPAIKEN